MIIAGNGIVLPAEVCCLSLHANAVATARQRVAPNAVHTGASIPSTRMRRYTVGRDTPSSRATALTFQRCRRASF